MMGRKAFTMFELLTVVIVIAVLAAIAVPNFLEAQVRAKTTQVLTNQRLIAAALESYYVDFKAYPPNLALVDFKVTETKRAAGIPELPEYMMRPGVGVAPEMVEAPGEPIATAPPARIITAEWITSKKIPQDFSIHRTVIPCSRCGFANPPEANSCYQCNNVLFPCDKSDIYSFSLDGVVLDALTTPIPYLPQGVNVDIFFRRGGPYRHPWSQSEYPVPFSYVNFTQIKTDGFDIPGVAGKARYAIISFGPDLQMTFRNTYPTPSFISYDPTNGTISPGDIITWHN
jgi:prepilin-type N-terminal cleavage/methylation domain-containing protein